MSSDLTALIVESEYIIALDIQMVLEAQGISSTIVRSAQDVHAMPPQHSKPSIAIVELEIDKPDEQKLARDLMQVGTHLIGISADNRIVRLLPVFSEVPVLIKPVPEAQLVAALQSVLRQSP